MRDERYSKKDEEEGLKDRMKKEEEGEGDDEEETKFSRL